MINIILITHEGIGTSMMNIAEAIIGSPLRDVHCYEVPMDADTEVISRSVLDNIEASQLDTLILTDLVGSTPYNVAREVIGSCRAKMVSGLNLPMLMRVLNYRAYRIEDIVDLAVEGGRLAIKSN